LQILDANFLKIIIFLKNLFELTLEETGEKAEADAIVKKAMSALIILIKIKYLVLISSIRNI